MPAKKKGRVTPKGTQPAPKGGANRRNPAPADGGDSRAAPGAPGATGRPAPARTSAPFRHRSR